MSQGLDPPLGADAGARASPRAGVDLAPEADSVRAARNFVARMLEVWHCDDPDEVVDLLTSEIVTNAVRHAVGAIRVEAALVDRQTLRVSAADDHPDVPVLRQPGPLVEDGRGIMLVGSLARRWGVEVEAGYKVVWFEAAIDRHDDPAPTA
ncbi:MAG TPA: ATP-binding protein [Acidimicrobiales bacterium]